MATYSGSALSSPFHLASSPRSTDKVTALHITALLGTALLIILAQHEQHSFQKPADW